MRALLVDPSKDIDDFITEIDIESWRDITPTIGGPCRTFTTVATDLLGTHTGYVDDEGLLNGQANEVGMFAVKDYEGMLAGRCVVQGVNWDTGEPTECEMSIREAQGIFGYLTPIGPMFRAWSGE
jgi:hypothetical protein